MANVSMSDSSRVESNVDDGGLSNLVNTINLRFRDTNNNASSYFIHITIPESSSEIDKEGKYAVFKIVIMSSFSRMEIVRRYRHFLVLHQELCHRLPLTILPEFPQNKHAVSLDPSFIEDRRLNLEVYLQQISQISDVWKCPRFMDFLDDGRSLLAVQVQAIRQHDEIQFLMQCNLKLAMELRDSYTAQRTYQSTINGLSARVQALENNKSRNESSAISAEDNDNKSDVLSDRNLYTGKSMLPPKFRSHSRSKSWTSVGSFNSFTPGYVSTQEAGDEDDHRSGSTPSIKSEDTYRRGSLSSIGEDYILPNSDLYEENRNSIAAGSNLSDICDWLLPPQNSPESGAYLSPQSKSPSKHVKIITDSLTIDMVPVNTVGTLLDDIIEDAINVLEPQENQLKFRSSIEKQVFDLCRKFIGAQVYEMGLHSLHCFLPDDDITMSVYLCRGLESTWYTRLVEKLAKASDGTESLDGSTSDNFLVKNTKVQMEGCEQHVQCTIGNTTIDIKANSKLDLCFMAFLEEFDRKIAKNHLFKRTLLLVRAWWTYEAPVYLKTRIQHSIFPHYAITVMVISVFQRHHYMLSFPFQALCMFFIDFVSFDWSGYALTIFGAVKLSSLPLDIVSYIRYCNHGGLISADMIRHWRDLALGVTVNTEAENAAAAAPKQKISTISSLFEVIQDAKEEPSSATSSSVNSSRYMTILHPLDFVLNVVPAAMTAAHLDMFSEIINVGASKISDTLRVANSFQDTTEDTNPLELNVVGVLFRETFARYGEGWRPDVLNASIDQLMTGGNFILHNQPRFTNLDEQDRMVDLETNPRNNDDKLIGASSKDCLSINLEEIVEQVKYCNFLEESQITEAALRILSMDILLDRGPLPVGEVGKMLQEFTGISTLSAYLKDKFGGLKKFLENLLEDFVISTDHPFNPHVFLVEQLTREDIAALAQGFIPNNLLSKVNKKKTARKKRNPSEPSMQFSPQLNGPTSHRTNTNTPPTNSAIYNSSNSPPFMPSSMYPSGKQTSHMHSGDNNNQSHNFHSAQSEYQYRAPRISQRDSNFSFGGVNNLPEQNWNDYNTSAMANQYTIGNSNFGKLGLPDPHAPAFVPGHYTMRK